MYTIEKLKEAKKYRRIRKIKKKQKKINLSFLRGLYKLKEPIYIPRNFSIENNAYECYAFFLKLKSKNYVTRISKTSCIINLSFSRIEEFDFFSLSILKSFMEYYNINNIYFKGNMPKNHYVKADLLQSGFFVNMYSDNQKIGIKGNGEYLSYEKKEGKILMKDLEDFENIGEKVANHLQIENSEIDFFVSNISSLYKEIGGNAVEWAKSKNDMWNISVKYEENMVKFTVCDLGRGIIDTLFIEKFIQLVDIMHFRDNLDILKRAFLQKYGSSSQEINRNRGLPMIKKLYDDKFISNLVVITNNVILSYDNKSYCLNNNFQFGGTYYYWEIIKK
ncbi:hypothetical protein ACTS9T_09705 [Empedobacter falsenii]